jgi:kynureninase
MSYVIAAALPHPAEGPHAAVRWIPAYPSESVGERLAAAVDDSVAGVITSTVFYNSAELAGGLELLSRRCQQQGVPLLLDAYHQLNVVPLSLPRAGLASAYLTLL